MNSSEEAKIVAVLQEMYPSRSFTPNSPEIWHRALADLNYADVNAALDIALRTMKFCPTVAELRELIADCATDIDTWEAAWKEVTDCRKKHGVYVGERWRNDAGNWSSPHIKAAIQHVGGYEAICAVTYDDESTMRAQFRNAYENARKAEVRREQIGDALIQVGPSGPRELT